MRKNLIDMITGADFSAETDFKNTLRERLFKTEAGKKSDVLRFQRLGDDVLDLVSAAGDADLLRKQEALRKNGQEQ